MGVQHYRPYEALLLGSLRNAQTDLAIQIWTILVLIGLKKPEKNRFGPFSYKFFVPIKVGLKEQTEPNQKLYFLRSLDQLSFFAEDHTWYS